MASFNPIRREVLTYLKACNSLLGRTKGAHGQFMAASAALQNKSGIYTDEELVLVQEMLHRVSGAVGNARYR